MPELPEVETVRRGLAQLLPGRMVRDVTVFDSPKSFPNDSEQVNTFFIGARVTAVRRRAKVLMIDLDTDYSLMVHLKMTGQLVFRPVDTSLVHPHPPHTSSSEHTLLESATGTSIERSAVISQKVDSTVSSEEYGLGGGSAQLINRGANEREQDFAGGHPNDSLIGKLPDRSTRVEIEFTDGSKLFFNDQRKFGWVKLVPAAEIEQLPFFQRVGPEPLDAKTTPELFIQRIRRRNGSMIKPAILDQSVIAGVGNIYADEALWAAKLHPETRVRDISDEQLNMLFTEIVQVLSLSIEKGGSTDKNYVDAEGRKGSYLSFAQVFRREGQPCHLHSDQVIVKLKVAGRGTHICPVCQSIVRHS